jgi:hypothetical protein
VSENPMPIADLKEYFRKSSPEELNHPEKLFFWGLGIFFNREKDFEIVIFDSYF